MAIEWVVIVEVNVLRERNVDKEQSLAFRGIAHFNVEVLFAEPLHLVGMDAAPSLLIQTVLVACV